MGHVSPRTSSPRTTLPTLTGATRCWPAAWCSPQRAYAVLSGMGGTSLDCGTAAMARLASGALSLEPFLANRGTSVGIEVFCRQPPACPRRLTSGASSI